MTKNEIQILAEYVRKHEKWPADLTPKERKAVEKILAQEYQTPPAFFAWLDQETRLLLPGTHGFDIDVCASESNAMCDLFITVEMDAFTKHWTSAYCRQSLAYCNPGYANVDKWTQRAKAEAINNNVSTALLSHSRADVEKFHKNRLGILAVLIINPRIEFIPPPGLEAPNKNNRGSMVLIITPESVRNNVEPTFLYRRWQP